MPTEVFFNPLIFLFLGNYNKNEEQNVTDRLNSYVKKHKCAKPAFAHSTHRKFKFYQH